jgi:hypothetical protein
MELVRKVFQKNDKRKKTLVALNLRLRRHGTMPISGQTTLTPFSYKFLYLVPTDLYLTLARLNLLIHGIVVAAYGPPGEW